MDKIIGNITSSSNNDADLKSLRNALNKEESVINKNLSNIDDCLNALDPTNHTLGYAYLLAAKATSNKIEPGKFVNQVIRFISSASNNQMRFAPIKIAIICRRFTEILVESNQAIKGVKVLRTAVKKAKPNSESLTPMHADLFQLCLLSKCYSAATSTLDEEIFEVSPETTGVTPKDMLLYYYYGGMLLTGVKEYKRALSFFRSAVCAPAVVISQIMIESYKKYILLSLLVNGKLASLPRYASAVVQRYHKNALPQYNEFVTSFGTGSTDDLHKCAEIHAELFTKDKNFGLVKQCIQSLYKRNIQKFTQTYVTFSLQDIATSVKLPSAKDAEKQLLKMVEAKEIFATVNQKDGMVSFLENNEQYDTSNVVAHLDSQIQKVIDMGKKIRTLDETIASSPNYLQKTALSERGGNRWSEYSDDFEAERPGGKLI